MLLIRGHVGHGTGAEAGGPAGDGDLEGALADQEDFFVCMVMCRMRHCPGRKVGLMHLYFIATVSLSFQDAAKRMSVTRLDGQVLESDCL